MKVMLIGSDKTVSRFLPDSIFTINYCHDVHSAADHQDYKNSDAVLLDLSSDLNHDFSLVNLLVKKWYVPVIVLVSDDKEVVGNTAIKNGAFDYLLKKEVTSKSLCRLIFNASISREIQMKAVQTNFLKQLKEDHTTCDVIFRNFPMGVIVLDSDKRIVYVNQSVESLLATPGKQLHNHFLTQFLYPDDIPCYIEKINYILVKGERSVIFDNRFISGNGDLSWQRLYLSLITDTGNRDIFFLFIARDINTEKRDEDFLKSAKTAAEDANQAKTEFLANMSHEIRTPIHTIVGMTELLFDTSLNKEQKRYVKQIRYSSDALLALINHVLDFSRIASGKVDIEAVEFNLYRMLENIIDLIIHDINKKHLEMILFIDSGVPELIRGDPIHLHQIIRNLLNNAVKFTEKGEIILSVTRIEENGSDITLRFSVQDTGIGIEEDQIKNIFSPFSQADNSYSREYGGTGVGLSIVKKLVELMDGRIEVESIKGKGSNFYFDMVFKEYQEGADDIKSTREVFKGTRVLVIDDKQTTLHVLKKYLEEWGCQVHKTGPEKFIEALAYNQVSKMFRNYDIGLINLRIAEIHKALAQLEKIQPGRKFCKAKLILLRPIGLLNKKIKDQFLHFFDVNILKPVKKRDLYTGIFKLVNPPVLEPVDKSLFGIQQNTEPEVITGYKARILVVEDHEVNREFFCTILNKMGYAVKSAENGMEAIHHVEDNTFDLIFMDIQMPGLNGYEVTGRLREKGIRIPIIAVTANTVKGEILRCLQAGMNDYLAKPFKKNDLAPLLNKWLEHDSLEPENNQKPAVTETPSVFDLDKAVDMFMGQEKVVIKLLSPFVERLALQIENMKEAVYKQECLTIQQEAHTIKGGALNIQAIELGTCARELEKLAREQQVDELADKVDELEKCYLRFKSAVTVVLEGRG